MTTVTASNAQVIAFQGGGDDMDLPIKHMSVDTAFAKKHGLCGVNSTNIGRPIGQMPHYFWTYFRVLDTYNLDVGEMVDFVLPTGAMGNMAAGTFAKKCGLPIGRFVAACNANDITDRAIRLGNFHRSEQMVKTLSEAINIQVPYNFERILYYLSGEDTAIVREWMSIMDSAGKLTLPQKWLSKLQDTYSSQ